MNSVFTRFSTVAVLILLATISRILPHPFNFTPIGAIALFGAAQFNRKVFAFMIPMVSMLLSDLFIGAPSLPTYVSFVLIATFGIFFLKKFTFGRIIVASLIASISFFLITNFFVWFQSSMYPQSWAGLIACYTAGLAFYQQTFWGNLFLNTVMGDFFYCSVLFGSYYGIQRLTFKPSMA
jgi:hypothetical protein